MVVLLVLIATLIAIPNSEFYLLHLYRTDDDARWATITLCSLSDVSEVIYALDKDRFYYDVEVL